jgi:apurinic endonuclease APN1
MLKLGNHNSIAWGLENARKESFRNSGNTCQIFTKSPRVSAVPVLKSDYIQSIKHLRKEYNQTGWIVHSNYLANLSKPRDQIPNDIEGIIYDIKVASLLDYDCVNVHIGKWKGFTNLDEAMSNMAHNVEYILKQTKDYPIQFCFENTAGQGSEIGSNLAELAELYNGYIKDLGVKYVIDTAHLQGGWIDCTKRNEFVEEFDNLIGIINLYAIHLNDSKVPLGAKLDRHAPLGKGFIGLPGLSPVIKWCSKNERMMIIETPDEKVRADEMQIVRGIANWSFDSEAFHKKNYKTDILKKFEATKDETWLFH